MAFTLKKSTRLGGMMRRLMFCSVFLVGCNGSPLSSPDFIAGDALLASVAPDESLVATIHSIGASSIRQLESTGDGELSIATPNFRGTWTSTRIDTDVSRMFGFSAEYLFYGVDHTHALPEGRFNLMAWKPGIKQPISLSTGPLATVALGGHGSIIYTGTGPTQGTLSALRLSDCDSGNCQPITLGQSGIFSLSQDGVECVFQTVTADGVDFFHFSFLKGTTALVGHVPTADIAGLDLTYRPLIRVSPDATRIAFMTPGGGLSVRPTYDDSSTVKWATLPDGAPVRGMAFADNSDLLLNLDAATGSFIYNSTPTELDPMAATAGGFAGVLKSDGVLGGAFITTSESPFAFSAYGLQFGTFVPVGSSAYGFPVHSDDWTLGFLLDQYLPDEQQGVLEVIDYSSLFLEGNLRKTVVGVSNPGGARFVPGTDELIFFNQGALSSWTGDAGVVTLAQDALTFLPLASRNLYVETGDLRSPGSWGHVVRVRAL